MKTMFRACLMLIAMLFVASLAAPMASAGFDVIQQTFVMDAATSSASTTITMNRSKITDVILWCPTLDSSDTGSLTIAGTLGSANYTPRGWSAHTIGATDDNALIQGNSSALDIITNGTVTVTVTTSTNQASARTFIVYLLREY